MNPVSTVDLSKAIDANTLGRVEQKYFPHVCQNKLLKKRMGELESSHITDRLAMTA